MSAHRHGHGHPRHGSGAGAGVFLTLVAVVVAFGSLLVWIAGAIAGTLTGHGPVLVNLSDAGTVLAKLPNHLDDPARAWPAAVRQQLPEPTMMLATLLIALGLLVALTATGVWLLTRKRQHTVKARRGARCATARDLQRLRVRRASRSRVILGRYQRQLIASEPRTSLLVSAPTQSGKTTSLVIPAILEWDGPILATSIKADLVNDTHSARTLWRMARARGESRAQEPGRRRC